MNIGGNNFGKYDTSKIQGTALATYIDRKHKKKVFIYFSNGTVEAWQQSESGGDRQQLTDAAFVRLS